MAGDRARLRATFDEAALLYDEVRPGYPEDLFDDVVSSSRVIRPPCMSSTEGGGHSPHNPNRPNAFLTEPRYPPPKKYT